MGTRKKIGGLYLRGNTWHIDKEIRGERVCRSTGTSDRQKAEQILMQLLSSPSKWDQLSGNGYVFSEAATRWVKDNNHLKSIERDTQDLKQIYPYIGKLPLKQVHQGTVDPYINARRETGIKSATVKRALSTIKRVLVAANTIYRDNWGEPWLDHVPKFITPKWDDERPPYPLSVEEQECLLGALCGSLRDIALFALHTGLRDQELTHLSWADEMSSEQGCLMFLLPAEHAKNGRSRPVVCNSVAKELVEARRGVTKDYIFEHHEGKARARISSGSGWKAGKKRAVQMLEEAMGTPATDGFKSLHFHDLRHTFGSHLMAAEVSYDVRRQLLGHKDGDITAHYCKVPNTQLIDAVKCLEPTKLPQKPRNNNVLHFKAIAGSRKSLKNIGGMVATGGLEPPTPAL
jgi:integrase